MSNAYIYQADIYCSECACDIRKQIRKEGNAPKSVHDADSDEWPQGPYDDGGGETDCPQHCGSGSSCINAMTCSDGRKVGMFLANPLTSDGEKYVRDEHRDNTSEITSFWMDYYALHGAGDDESEPPIKGGQSRKRSYAAMGDG